MFWHWLVSCFSRTFYFQRRVVFSVDGVNSKVKLPCIESTEKTRQPMFILNVLFNAETEDEFDFDNFFESSMLIPLTKIDLGE